MKTTNIFHFLQFQLFYMIFLCGNYCILFQSQEKRSSKIPSHGKPITVERKAKIDLDKCDA